MFTKNLMGIENRFWRLLALVAYLPILLSLLAVIAVLTIVQAAVAAFESLRDNWESTAADFRYFGRCVWIIVTFQRSK